LNSWLVFTAILCELTFILHADAINRVVNLQPNAWLKQFEIKKGFIGDKLQEGI